MNATQMRFARMLFASLFLILGFTTQLPAKQPKAEKVVTIEGITEYKLANGVRFLLFPDPSSSTVTVNMTILVGSRHEGYGETGMAHLLEHMLFKGSKNFPEADKALTSRGAEANGTTWTDRTNYYETMPASEENLEFGIKFEADRLLNCFIKREDLAKEMTVVRNEFEQGENNPVGILNQRMMAAAFEWHNYGKSTIGNRTDIERVPIDRLQAFYRKYYQPDNIVLVVTGKFDPAKAIDLIEKNFGTMKRPERVLDNTYTEEPPQDGERSVTLRRVGKVPVVGMMYHIPGATHLDNPICDVVSLVLGTAPSGRLYKALVDTKKATSVSVGCTNWHDPGTVEIFANVADKVSPEEVRDIIIKEVENMNANPVTQDEVARAVKKYLSNREQSLARSKAIGLEISEWIGAGDWRLLFIHRDIIAKAKPEDVTRVAGAYFKPSNRTVGMFIPSNEVARTPIPNGPTAAELVKDYKGGQAIAEGETFDPTPKNLDARIQKHTLSNGIKVSMLPKKTRGETVVGQLILRYGNEKSLAGNTVAGQIMPALMRRGTKQHTREQLQDTLDKLSSTLNASAGATAGVTSFSWNTKRGQLADVLGLLGEVLREPTFPEKEFEEIVRNSKQSLEKSLTDPQALAFNTLVRTLHPYSKEDVRYRTTPQEGLERLSKVTRDDVVKLYQTQFGGNHGELVLIGDFDPPAVLKQMETILAGFKSDTPYQRIDRVADTKVAGKKENILTPDKEGATYVAGMTFNLRDDDPAYPALELGNHLLGGNFTSRLVDKLRQKDGLCYGAGSRVSVDTKDPYGLFYMFAICNPENIDKVDKGAVGEVVKLLKEGVSADELAEGKKSYLQELVVDRGNDGKLLAMMQDLLHHGRTFEYLADFENKVANLSVEEVNRVLRSILLSDRLVIVRAGDFNKKK